MSKTIKIKKLALLFSVFVLAGCSFGNGNTPEAETNLPSSILKSTDGGKTWETKSQSESKINFSGMDVISLAVNANDSNNVYVGTQKDGIIKTDDGGETWSALNFQSEKVYGLGLDPVDGRIIYASGVWQKRGKIFKSLDAGKNWKEIYTFASDGPLIISLTIDKKNPKNIFATTSDGTIIESEDSGESWKNIYKSSTPILGVTVSEQNNQWLYFNPMDRGLYRSFDGGKEFKDLSQKLSEAKIKNDSVSFITTDPQNGKTVYAGGKAGIIKSQDGGDIWTSLDILNNSNDAPAKALIINPKNSQEIIYGATQAVYRSIDGGETWSTSQIDAGKNINVLKYDSQNPSTLYLGLSK
ncbi:MAG: hypothetical protein COU40_03045 [Candidatus Moranbacteria bacterium CG10_big_fil_rev_8_21_14_0_10_35_21]|nr:MAG: hypothetical protein COU40_03045 [Candidatus Moranbacteria bacterium CG10_big_fil_rev_8_21_14_0_10_35_21]PJA88274.1 MAG: hypothetical protein CO139_04050 [Candidatus Moranbacteria bacterium CG_4_9_14_3_um_filter_36_9]